MSAGPGEAVKWSVRGRVQGVGFRYFVMRRARALGVVGWIRNEPDGSVEIRVQGEPTAVDALREHVGKGPPGSRILGIDEREIEADPRWVNFGIEL